MTTARPHTHSIATPALRVVPLAVAAIVALGLLAPVAATAQGLLGAPEAPAKQKKPNRAVNVAAAQPHQSKADNSKPVDDALAYCNQMEAKQLSLRAPGGKALVQFDKCYRGRLHNQCLAKALSVMYASLSKDYEKLIETNYPAISSTSSVCQYTAGQLTEDLETAKAFAARYKALTSGYEERLKCTDSVLKALEKAAFPEMPNMEKTVKTMADDLKNDIANFAKERQAADDLLNKVTDAHKALEVQTDIHRAMCITADARPGSTAEVNLENKR